MGNNTCEKKMKHLEMVEGIIERIWPVVKEMHRKGHSVVHSTIRKQGVCDQISEMRE